MSKDKREDDSKKKADESKMSKETILEEFKLFFPRYRWNRRLVYTRD